ncbi:hypothetical protein ACFYE9_18990 [Rhizobium leguminosarum]|uniref:Uncharacterized protein n=1 Tax=Rhizobium leguminosarum TaxID=384 RepID=A0ACD5FAN3_RHILE|nr:hypothetical protein [Rhizobium leguminosarum]
MPPRSSLQRLHAKAMLSRLLRPQVLKGFGIPRLLMWRFVAQNHGLKPVVAAAALFLAHLDAFLNVAGHDQPVMGSMAGPTTVRRCLP